MKLLHALQKGREVRIYGSSGARRSTRIQQLYQPGSAWDYASEAGLLYDNNVVLSVINRKANAISECELVIDKFDGKKWERQTEQGQVKDALKVIDIPNEYYDGSLMFRGSQLSWDTRGQWFFLKRRDNIGRLIGFYWCPHYQIRPLADVDNESGTKLVTRYEYTPLNGPITYLDVRDVVHVRHGIDPRDWASGLSPLAAALREVCSDNEVSNWLASILRNKAMPGTILMPKGDAVAPPTQEQRQGIKELWNQFTHDKRGETLLLPIPFDIISPEFSPQQMDLGNLRKIPGERILMALGVDPMAMGLPSESKTYANYAESLDAMGRMTILPSISAWAQQMGRQILPEFGLDPVVYRYRWETSAVSWLSDDRDALHKRVRDDFRAGVIDRATAKVSIGVPALPGDVGVYATTKMAPEPDQDDNEDKDPTE